MLIKTIKNNDKAIIVVDCDCDGYTSAAALLNYLHSLFPFFVENNIKYIMHEDKQHGLNDCINSIVQGDCSLVILPDSGSNDVNECQKLYNLKKSIIILDHHICQVKNPYACVINSQNEGYPNKQLSGVGVVYQFCRYIDKLLKTDNSKKILDLVALGLTGDMMSLLSLETKELIKQGFKKVENPFFKMMARHNSYSMEGKINPMTVAFYVVPFINAITRSGTIEQKDIVFESMLDYKAYRPINSTKYKYMNNSILETSPLIVQQAIKTAVSVKARQSKKQNILLEILQKKIEKEKLLEHKVLLFLMESEEMDKNIAGLCANKMMAKYQRPVCILTKHETNPNHLPWQGQNRIIYQGSMRGYTKTGIASFKKICEDTKAVQYVIGHDNAAGIAIQSNKIQTFLKLTDAILANVSDEIFYSVDYIFKGERVDAECICTIANMQDYWGQDVPEPLICIKGLKVSKDMVTTYMKKTNTIKISLYNGVELMKFNATEEQCQKFKNNNYGYYQIDIIGCAKINTWRGALTPQIFIQDYSIIDSSEYYF